MNFLLVNYDYPPNPGIGGRRWAKLTKALALAGHHIFVIKADQPAGGNTSPWTSDTKHPNIHVYEATRAYPKALSHPEKTIVARAQYKFHKWLLTLKQDGTIYDQSIGWEKNVLSIAKEIISKNTIDVIVATGAPWNLLVYAARLKEEFPACKLLADYRDPWLTALNYGMAGLNSKRKNAEAAKQKFVFEHADFVTTPYTYLTRELEIWSRSHCQHQPTFATIEHFFDVEDFTGVAETHAESECFRLVYAGDMYIGSEPQWRQFAAIVQSYESDAASRHQPLQIDLYTSATVPDFIRSIPRVTIHRPVGKSIFRIMQEADALLIVLPDNKKDELTTKFYEYLPLRKPIFMVASTGEATRFIATHRLGIQATQTALEVTDFFSGNFGKKTFNIHFDLSSHTSNQRAIEVLTLVK